MSNLISMIHNTQNFVHGNIQLTPAFIKVLQESDLDNIIIEFTIKTTKKGVLSTNSLLEYKKIKE